MRAALRQVTTARWPLSARMWEHETAQAEVQAEVLEAAVAWTAQTWFQRR